MNHQFSLLAYRNRLLLLLGVVALCGALVACGGMTTKPDPVEPVDPTPVDPVTPTVPPEIAMDIEMSLRTMLLALTDPQVLAVPQTEAGVGSEALVNCSSMSTGDQTDGDGDNYPVGETRTFDCDLVFPTGMVTLELMDKDDADPASGVKAEVDTSYGFGDQGFSITSEVSLDASRSDGAADYAIEYTGSVGFATPFVETELTGRYDATLAGTFAAGTAGVLGGFTFTTTPVDCATVDPAVQDDCRTAVQDAPGGSFQLGVRTSELVYDAAACATTFTGGYFEVTDPADNVLKSTYTGCGPATVTYNGQPVPPPEVPS